MEKILTSRNPKHFDIIFNDDSPHQKSLASLILLNDILKQQDEYFLKKIKSFNDWLDFREEYLNEVLKEKDILTCSYCPKSNLEIGGKSIKDIELNNKNPNLATIDHIIPLSNGGEKYNKNNICISCKKCNSKKSNKPVEYFISTKKTY